MLYNIGIAVGFDPVSYTRGEGDGFVDLTFRKFSNPASLMENITVVFSTSDGSAEGYSVELAFLFMHVLVAKLKKRLHDYKKRYNPAI